MMNMEMMNELKKAVENYMAWEQEYEHIATSKLPDKWDIQDSIREQTDDFCDEVANLIWDLFTDFYGLTDAQHNDYEYFDAKVEELEKIAGTISYIASTEDSDIPFLNPMPIVFLNELVKEFGDKMEIDEHDNVARFYC